MIRSGTQLATRFGRNRSGAAAIEFALVVPFVLAMVFSTLEAGWIMVQSIMLDRALDVTVRELRIGSFANPTQLEMRQRICDRAVVLHDCQNTLTLELVAIDPGDYPADAARCIDRTAEIEPVLRFNPGLRSQIVFVRACYIVEPLTPDFALGLVVTKDASGAMRLVSTSGFVNEPA